MVRLSLFIFVLFIGISMIIARNDIKFRKIQQKRFSRTHEQTRNLRNLVGKLVDTETNTIYNVDGQKEQDIPLIIDTTTTAPLALNSLPTHEEIICLAACHSCFEEYPIGSRKKRAADNCGPMCDCADSCFRMTVEQVGKIYGQSSNTLKDKDCWWRTYSEMLNKQIPLSA